MKLPFNYLLLLSSDLLERTQELQLHSKVLFYSVCVARFIDRLLIHCLQVCNSRWCDEMQLMVGHSPVRGGSEVLVGDQPVAEEAMPLFENYNGLMIGYLM